MKLTHKWQLYHHFWPSIAISMVIFHKTEIQTVILRCITGLNLDWFKIYGLRCRMRLCVGSANSQKIATAKWPFKTISGHFFASYMFIFHKTEVQTVILRCLTSLNLIWIRHELQIFLTTVFLNFGRK